MRTVRSGFSILLLGLGLAACRNPTSPEAQVTAVFNQWNQLAISGDPGAAKLLCDGVTVPDPAYFGMILPDHRGYRRPSKLSVSVTDAVAEVDFNEQFDDFYEMVYLHFEKQNGKWKVCYEQTTGPGGFG